MKIKLLTPTARIPTYATADSAAFDIYADHTAIVRSGTTTKISTGLSVQIPQGHAMMIYSRSGMGFNHSTRLCNCVGVIDADYRGEIMVGLTCDDPRGSFTVRAGDRIAQGAIQNISKTKFEVVDTLEESARGNSGFGSTGE